MSRGSEEDVDQDWKESRVDAGYRVDLSQHGVCQTCKEYNFKYLIRRAR